MREQKVINRMNCPYCGCELKDEDICGSCGRDIKSAQPDIEVEYKEFKISEFLEIRKAQQQLPAKGSSEPLPLELITGDPVPSDKYQERELQQNMPSEKGRKNNALLYAAWGLIIITVIAGIAYIMRLLFR
jgi:hypothetical protein